MLDVKADESLSIEEKTLAVRQQGIVDRAVILSLGFAVCFGLYGFSSLSFINLYRPDITLWQNLWPRLLFNTIPFLGLAWFLKFAKVSSTVKTWVWAVAWPLIDIFSGWIYVLPIFFGLDPKIYFFTHGANIFVFALSTLWITPLPKQMMSSFLILLSFFYSPILYGLLWKKGNEPALTLFLNDEILVSIFVPVTTYLSHLLLTRLIKNEQISQNDLKAEVTNRDKIIFQKTKEAVELELAARLGQQAVQIAHDLRSPLAALKVVVNDLSEVKQSKREILALSMNRLQEIAKKLLVAFRVNHAEEINKNSEDDTSIEVAPLIEKVVNEKRIQYQELPNVKLVFDPTNTDLSVRCKLEPVEFQRILSNLFDNAFESIEDSSPGLVRIELTCVDGCVFIFITDSGKGIPLNILPRLGQKGFTFGKVDGSGLGFYHAKLQIEKWGGTIRIDSMPMAGTKVTVCLPVGSLPNTHK